MTCVGLSDITTTVRLGYQLIQEGHVPSLWKRMPGPVVVDDTRKKDVMNSARSNLCNNSTWLIRGCWLLYWRRGWRGRSAGAVWKLAGRASAIFEHTSQPSPLHLFCWCGFWFHLPFDEMLALSACLGAGFLLVRSVHTAKNPSSHRAVARRHDSRMFGARLTQTQSAAAILSAGLSISVLKK